MKKVCTKCEAEKDLDEFYRTKRSKDGRQPRCKVCMRDSYNSSRAKKREHYNKVRRDRRAAKLQRWREWKEAQGCKYCSESFGPCLQLHHLDSEAKEAAISDMVTGDATWNRIMNEAAKCIVVCGNCHTKIHHGIISGYGAAW